MAWEKQIIGHTIKLFGGKECIPTDAKFIGMTSRVVSDYSTGRQLIAHTYHYQVPIYKKVRTKIYIYERGKTRQGATHKKN